MNLALKRNERKASTVELKMQAMNMVLTTEEKQRKWF